MKKIQPEHIRKKAMNDYADLQIFKLKVVVGLIIIVVFFHWL